GRRPVVLAPPDQRDVDDVAEVLVLDRGARGCLDLRPQLLVAVAVVAELLDDLARADAQRSGVAGGLRPCCHWFRCPFRRGAAAAILRGCQRHHSTCGGLVVPEWTP